MADVAEGDSNMQQHDLPAEPELTPEERIRRFYEVQGMDAPAPQAVAIASTVSPDSEGAQELARVGAWREIVKLAGLQVYSGGKCDPKERMRRTHIYVIALVKLNRRPQASAVLEGLPEADMPFSLLLLRAELLADSINYGREASQRALYTVFNSLPAHHDPLTDRRRKAVTLSLVSSHLALGQAGCALKLLTHATQEYPDDLKVLHRYAALLMQTGHIEAARATYDSVCALPPSTPHRQNTISVLSGMLAICNGNFTAADASFSSGVTASNCINMNNKAVCAVYSEQLPNGIRILEEAVRVNPTGLTETAAANLFTLYDMESEFAAEKRKTLEAVAAAYKGADFAEYIKQPNKQG